MLCNTICQGAYFPPVGFLSRADGFAETDTKTCRTLVSKGNPGMHVVRGEECGRCAHGTVPEEVGRTLASCASRSITAQFLLSQSYFCAESVLFWPSWTRRGRACVHVQNR